MVGQQVIPQDEDYDLLQEDITPAMRAAGIVVVVGIIICTVLFLIFTREAW